MSNVKYRLKHGGRVEDFLPAPIDPAPEQETVTIDSLEMLKKAANYAAKRYVTGLIDTPDRRDEAFCGIAEQLIGQGELSFFDAVDAGTRAINRAAESYQKHHGLPRLGNPSSRVGEKFAIFWHPAHIPGFSLDYMACHQVFDELRVEDQDTLLAFATTRDVQRAAEVQGVKYSTYVWRLKRARTAALELWFDHEAPMKLWPNAKPRKTHCPKGHSYEQYSRWYFSKTRNMRIRQCAACARINDKNRDYSKRRKVKD